MAGTVDRAEGSEFGADDVWLFVTLLAYMISAGFRSPACVIRTGIGLMADTDRSGGRVRSAVTQGLASEPWAPPSSHRTVVAPNERFGREAPDHGLAADG